MHSWGDDWPHWKELNEAERTLYFYGKKLGNIDGYMKEKWGSIRWDASIRKPSKLHDIVKAGHVAYRWSPDNHPILCLIDNFSKSYMCLFGSVVYHYRKFMYGFAYHIACKKHPNVIAELLECVEWEDLLFEKERQYRIMMYKENEDEQETT